MPPEVSCAVVRRRLLLRNHCLPLIVRLLPCLLRAFKIGSGYLLRWTSTQPPTGRCTTTSTKVSEDGLGLHGERDPLTTCSYWHPGPKSQASSCALHPFLLERHAVQLLGLTPEPSGALHVGRCCCELCSLLGFGWKALSISGGPHEIYIHIQRSFRPAYFLQN